MNRIIRAAATLLAVAAIGATMATTVTASSAVPTIAKSGSRWSVVISTGCENVALRAGHKFVADIDGDKGTWQEPTHSTITMTWTGGPDSGTVFKGMFKAASGEYVGSIKFPGQPTFHARLIPFSRGAC